MTANTGGRTLDTVAIRRPAGVEMWFDQGLVALRHPAPDERAAIVAALGLTVDDPHPTDAPRIAAPGAPRMLVPVHDRSALLRVCPHLGRLTAACRRYGLLGCFVYVPPVGDRPGAARMFAPAIGVDEDVANANSTGCLAAHLLDTTGAQTVAIEVEQGDTLGRPASVLASARGGGHHDPGRRVSCGPRRPPRRQLDRPLLPPIRRGSQPRSVPSTAMRDIVRRARVRPRLDRAAGGRVHVVWEDRPPTKVSSFDFRCAVISRTARRASVVTVTASAPRPVVPRVVVPSSFTHLHRPQRCGRLDDLGQCADRVAGQPRHADATAVPAAKGGARQSRSGPAMKSSRAAGSPISCSPFRTTAVVRAILVLHHVENPICR
jgi:Phenazine biosynthesis-like protein